MASVYPIIADMRRGEVSPLAHGAVDSDTYAAAMAQLQNWIVTRYGGVTRRPGTFFDNEAKNHDRYARFIEFIFSETQAYAIEFGHEYVRFHTISGVVESGGSPYEVVTPYQEADLDKIQYAQSGDVVYLACAGYAPRTLTRSSETSWALAEHDTKDGPYLPENETSTTMTPAETGHATPKMTSNTAPSGVVSSSAGATDAWNAFDRDKTNVTTLDGGSSGWLQYDFGSGNDVIVDHYWLTASETEAQWGDMPTQWELQGSSDGSTWVTLDSRDDETGWSGSETRFFDFVNKTAFRYYRWSFSGGGGGDGSNSDLSELALGQAASDQTPFDLTASAVTGINGGSGFQSTDVGRLIRLLGADGVWRWAEITAISSTTVVKIRLHGHALPDTSPIIRWRLSAWSEYDDYPAALSFYEDRLGWAGTETRPLTVNLSRSADYDHHGLSDPIVADDAVSVTMSGGRLNRPLWMVESGDLIIGTTGGIRILSRNNQSEAFSPTNARQKSQTAVRASSVRPLLIDRTVIFAEKHRKSLYETAFTFEADGYVAYELTWLAEHLFWGQIRGMIFQEVPFRVLWVWLEDGSCVSCTYDREQKVFGVTPVETAGGLVETMVALPGTKFDVVLAIVKRTIDGSTKRYVERMAEPYRVGKSDIDIPVYMDCCVRYQGVSTSTITGADHLEGRTVGVYVDGVDVGDATVSGGSFTIPEGISGTDVLYGLRMTSRGKTLRLNNAGNRDGAHLGRRKRIVSGILDVFETYGLKGGSTSQIDDLKDEEARADPPLVPELYTGTLRLHTDDSWLNNGVYVFETDRNYPATVRAVIAEVEGEP